MKKILIILIILFSVSSVVFADSEPLTLQNFNFEFEYILGNDFTLHNFNFEFEYIEDTTPTFIFNLVDYISDYERYKKITELYPQLSELKSLPEFWRELAILENDNYYREPNLTYLKFKRLSEKYK